MFGFKPGSGIQMSRPIKMLACGTRECALDTCGQIRTDEPVMTSQVVSRVSFMTCGTSDRSSTKSVRKLFLGRGRCFDK